MLYTFSITFLIGLLGLILYKAWIRSAQDTVAKSHGCQLPPRRQTRDPILGSDCKLQDFRAMSQYRILPAGGELHEKHGKTFYEASIFGITIKSTAAENLQAVFGLKAKEWGVAPFRQAGLKPFSGEGFIAADGPVWEHSRAMLKPSFHKSNIADLSPLERPLAYFFDQIPRDGSTFEMQNLLSKLFADTATIFILGESLGISSNERVPGLPTTGEKFLESFQKSLIGCGLRMYLGPFRFIVPSSVTTKPWKVVHEVIDFFIERALTLSDSGTRKPTPKYRSLIDMLLQQTRDKVEVRNQLIQGIMASLDTTAMLLSNTIFLLARNPDIYERLRAVVESIETHTLTLEDTKNFKFVRNILHESLRIYPVFAMLARDALIDTILPTGGGPNGDKPIFAPAGTRILLDFYSLHRNPEVFGADAGKFNPDRWDSIQPGPWQYFAFGGGARPCIGQQKAFGEASYILIRIAQMFKKIEPRDERPWSGELQLITRNHWGCHVAVVPA